MRKDIDRKSLLVIFKNKLKILKYIYNIHLKNK